MPKAPKIVLGVVNVQGKIIPVFNLRKRFGLRERETNLGDQLVIAHAAGRSVALVVDSNHFGDRLEHPFAQKSDGRDLRGVVTSSARIC